MKKITENTPFVNGGESLGMTMLDFWKYQYSNIYDMQEYIAEFIVGKALGIDEPMNRNGWTSYDIDYDGIRIEVKETGYYYSWQYDGQISQRRSFDIHQAKGKGGASPERQNDIYVFCLNTGTDEETSNPLDMSNWEFYVIPTHIINDKCQSQKSISLGRVSKLAPLTRYEELKNVIDSICETIKK